MKTVIILGAGRVGAVIARDLNDNPNIQVTVADRRSELLDHIASQMQCETICDDFSKPDTVKKVVDDFDLAIGALPGPMGLNFIKGAIAAKKPCVDISFTKQDPEILDDDAKASGIPVLYDFGIAPGMSNLLAAASINEIESAKQLRILVGGLPTIRRPPWEYAAPFSPIDVMEEYTRPARIRINNQNVERKPLSGVEEIKFPEVGTLEAFYTDGLRSLLRNCKCPAMEEKTLRYPGHAAHITLLRDSGFLGRDPVDINGIKIAPIDFTLRMLEPVWHLDHMAEEFTIMRITVVGGEPPVYNRIEWNLLDRTDRTKNETSMARTTGFPAAIAATKILDGTLNIAPGVHPPESLATDSKFIDSLLSGLEARDVIYRKTVA